MNDRKKVYYFKKKEIPYFIAYFLMAFSNVVIANSYLFGENRYDICVFVQYISCILFIVALCTGKYKLRDLIVRGLIGIIVIFITINLRSTEFGVYSLAIIASLNIDSKRIVRFNVISNICFIVSVVLPALIGIIPNDIYIHEGKKAYALGFSYYSNIPYMVLVVTLALFWLANSQKKEKIVLITSIPIQILIYKVSTTILVLGIYCVFMVAVLLSRLLNTNKKHKVLIFFSAIMFPCAAIITFLISIYYTKNSFFMTLNKLLNNRLEFNARAFRMYNISIGGQKIITSNGGFDADYVNHYFYVDSGYVYTLISYGIIFFIILIFLYSFLFQKAVRDNEFKLAIWCLVICIFSVINNIMLKISINPLPILALDAFTKWNAGKKTKVRLE